MEPAPGAEEATQSWARLRNDRRLEFGVEIAALPVLAILCVLIIKPFVTAALWFSSRARRRGACSCWLGESSRSAAWRGHGGEAATDQPQRTRLILVMLGLLGNGAATRPRLGIRRITPSWTRRSDDSRFDPGHENRRRRGMEGRRRRPTFRRGLAE